ncbi:MAG: alpha/beta fold hydrolase [Hyphomicrobium sp.]
MRKLLGFFVAFCVVVVPLPRAFALATAKIGIDIRTLEPSDRIEKKIPFGVFIERVAADSPAARVGLEPGDVILAVDTQPVTSATEFVRALKAFGEQDAISLTVIAKNGKEAVVALRLDGESLSSRDTSSRSVADQDDQPRKYSYKRAYKSSKSQSPSSVSPPSKSPSQDLCGNGECTPVKVYYATDRRGKNDPSLGRTYSAERISNQSIETGICWVTIPKAHEVGEIEVPSLVWLEFHQDPSKHIIVARTNELDSGSFYNNAREDLIKAPTNSALIYVHGYWNTFEAAAQRTAQLAFDLKFKGLPVFFSWPSQGRFFGYTMDETNVEWAATDLRRFLRDFVRRTDVEHVYLVAHSMGNRALLKAIAPLMTGDSAVRSKITEVILAAPDIDAEVFKREIAPMIFTGSPASTLYASSRDWALRASRYFHGYPRAGETDEGLTIVSNVATIDASNVDTDWLGHAYFSQSKSIISDIDQIFEGVNNPDNRENIDAGDFNGAKYWVLAK